MLSLQSENLQFCFQTRWAITVQKYPIGRYAQKMLQCLLCIVFIFFLAESAYEKYSVEEGFELNGGHSIIEYISSSSWSLYQNKQPTTQEIEDFLLQFTTGSPRTYFCKKLVSIRHSCASPALRACMDPWLLPPRERGCSVASVKSDEVQLGLLKRLAAHLNCSFNITQPSPEANEVGLNSTNKVPEIASSANAPVFWLESPVVSSIKEQTRLLRTARLENVSQLRLRYSNASLQVTEVKRKLFKSLHEAGFAVVEMNQQMAPEAETDEQSLFVNTALRNIAAVLTDKHRPPRKTATRNS
ncbi:uncharacterized protein LOC108681023 [Hyalella azteca]|uniref:Uncharacterized protein LOC108681023 n=1 Tax=Hyalella azteca TaxID=294128 RepID=A0A8B7PH24_HYAAZ|nr:uncharacterized protein LOC108681023 [Hyalella azteca]